VNERRMTMDEDQVDVIARKLDSVANKLDALIRLGVMQMGEGKTQSERIWLYAVAGFSPKQIAPIIGTSSNAVRVVLSNLRKSRKNGRLRKGRAGE
jgi:DNA-directed RNA polymerase specialized sigma24 family protein